MEKYKGKIKKIGVDVGLINGGRIEWEVWEKKVRKDGELKGSYVGE